MPLGETFPDHAISNLNSSIPHSPVPNSLLYFVLLHSSYHPPTYQLFYLFVLFIVCLLVGHELHEGKDYGVFPPHFIQCCTHSYPSAWYTAGMQNPFVE